MTTAFAVLVEGFTKVGFGERDYHNTTVLHPLGLAALAVLALSTVAVSRRHAAIPFLAMAVCISPAQRIIIAGFDFHFIRLLVLAGWIRIFARSEYREFRWQRLDTLVVVWALVSTVAQVIRGGTTEILIFRIGRTYDVVGMYLFFRCVIRSWRDVEAAIRGLAIIVVPAAAAFAAENKTGRNIFSIFGGVPEFTSIRHGKLRCQGPFPHPILAGCFFAAWLPVLLALISYRSIRMWGLVAGVAVTSIVFVTASSTPATGYLAAIAFVMAWPLRRHMKTIRYGAVTAALALHLVMKAPVWHLISRISLSKGSTSYHRYLLIDNAVNRYHEWAFIGVDSTSHWGHAQYDITNQFVLEGVTGGTLTLVLFVAMIGQTFALVGRTWRLERSAPRQRLSWALGASLAVQCLMFIGTSISHSPQNLLVFFFVLAAVGSLHQHASKVAAARSANLRSSRRRPARPSPETGSRRQTEPSGVLGDLAPI